MAQVQPKHIHLNSFLISYHSSSLQINLVVVELFLQINLPQLLNVHGHDDDARGRVHFPFALQLVQRLPLVRARPLIEHKRF